MGHAVSSDAGQTINIQLGGYGIQGIRDEVLQWGLRVSDLGQDSYGLRLATVTTGREAQVRLLLFTHVRDLLNGRTAIVPVGLRVLLGMKTTGNLSHLRDLLVASLRSFLVVGDFFVNLEKNVLTRGGVPISLTPSEFRMFLYFARNPKITLRPSKLLAAYRDDPQLPLSDKEAQPAAKVGVSDLRRKIEVDPAKPAYIVTQHGQGYRFEPQQAPTPEAA